MNTFFRSFYRLFWEFSGHVFLASLKVCPQYIAYRNSVVTHEDDQNSKYIHNGIVIIIVALMLLMVTVLTWKIADDNVMVQTLTFWLWDILSPSHHDYLYIMIFSR